jgi:hypothetical protein
MDGVAETDHFDVDQDQILLYEVQKFSHFLQVHHWWWCSCRILVPNTYEVVFVRRPKKFLKNS